MKALYVLLMLTVYQTYGQTPGKVRSDSMPVARPERGAVVPMPTTLPNNAFYRSPNDPAHVVRATLDNMTIHGYDTTARRSPTIRRVRPKK